ncbi:MAG: putative manganese-dependent inorganic diphosphatase [Thermoanaerobacteraceae bacterium]|uniref:putative manganese-dependent inorganic diphosphatase n=1 Tax=Thermanaeromonas sp. C210 TaxID=2731925 RepID=UPI00155D12C6|nr:putative manganese-dependent inorganic diphosphatase [Thermanaeromonas sp. C210]MBE3581930.1 putative manganese-dependent inorganic diphosphatase [Thermoanaerobacteraceae bacterium]GFN22688.1 manganese-dependent inorganic pyrophosphatase [Thermanaeromonas sp. C210]
MAREILVIGHQKPDTDSIASAIGYAYLQNRIRKENNVIAARCGELNRETQFVLEYFNVPAPIYVDNVKTKVEDVLDGGILFIRPEVTVRQAGIFMRQHGVKTLAVVDGEQHLLGLLTVGDLARLLLEAWDSGYVPMDAPVKNIMRTENLVVFHNDDLVEEVKRTMLETRYRNYPVVDEHNRFMGMIARYHLLAMRGKKLILVDHNERSQAVPGIEQAEILEIIDHHRVADIETSEPILVRNEPVGSTSTIISKIFAEKGITPPKEIAGILCAAILSDTMILKSPTTTEEDRQQVAKLGELAGLNPTEFGKKMFQAGSLLAGRSGRDILLEDFKEFCLGNHIVGIGQIEIVDQQALPVSQEVLLEEMDKLCKEKNYDLVLLMITDLMRNGTELFFTGHQARAVEQAFNVPPGKTKVFLPGVMSRKKQVVPPLRRVLLG